ncbi:unnamed protein product [Lathyrus oleraceus]
MVEMLRRHTTCCRSLLFPPRDGARCLEFWEVCGSFKSCRRPILLQQIGDKAKIQDQEVSRHPSYMRLVHQIGGW